MSSFLIQEVLCETPVPLRARHSPRALPGATLKHRPVVTPHTVRKIRLSKTSFPAHVLSPRARIQAATQVFSVTAAPTPGSPSALNREGCRFALLHGGINSVWWAGLERGSRLGPPFGTALKPRKQRFEHWDQVTQGALLRAASREVS